MQPAGSKWHLCFSLKSEDRAAGCCFCTLVSVCASVTWFQQQRWFRNNNPFCCNAPAMQHPPFSDVPCMSVRQYLGVMMESRGWGGCESRAAFSVQNCNYNQSFGLQLSHLTLNKVLHLCFPSLQTSSAPPPHYPTHVKWIDRSRSNWSANTSTHSKPQSNVWAKRVNVRL